MSSRRPWFFNLWTEPDVHLVKQVEQVTILVLEGRARRFAGIPCMGITGAAEVLVFITAIVGLAVISLQKQPGAAEGAWFVKGGPAMLARAGEQPLSEAAKQAAALCRGTSRVADVAARAAPSAAAGPNHRRRDRLHPRSLRAGGWPRPCRWIGRRRNCDRPAGQGRRKERRLNQRPDPSLPAGIIRAGW